MDRNSPTTVLEDAVERFFSSEVYPSLEEFLDGFIDDLDRHCARLFRKVPCDELGIAITTAAGDLYLLEGFIGNLERPTELGSVDRGRYRDHLFAILSLADDPTNRLAAFKQTLLECFDPLIKALPTTLFVGDDHPETVQNSTVHMLEVLSSPADVIEQLQYPIFRSNGFRYIRSVLAENGESITSEIGKVVLPTEYHGEPHEIAHAYLRDTPFAPLFNMRMPFVISIEDRGEHTAIVAGAGWGKTQLLQSIIAGDLEYEDPPAIIVIDSTGAMVQRIQRLAIFNERLKDRLLIIDPELDPVPALNPFDLSNPRFATYDAGVQERMQGEVIDLFNYVFSTIKNPLSTRMQTAFAFMVRLLLSIPDANIHTLLELLNDDPPRGDYQQAAFKSQIDRLDPTTQLFFKAQYYTGRDGGLREQIRARVFDILRVPAFERMFSTVNKVDFFTELNRGSIVLVNTSENLLKEGSATFGRYIIARVMAAAFERAPIPPEERRQAFLIIDEAALYFDEQFEKLLNRVRQFRLGAVIAFQNLEQASEKLRSTIASSTAIKYAGGTGDTDARWLSREMRCKSEFIMNQKRDARPPKWTQFACFVRNFTDRAVSLTVPFFTIENMPKMSGVDHAAMLARNHQRVAAPHDTPRPAAPPPPSPQPAPIEALAKAYADLAAAMTRADWGAVAEFKDGIIPALEREVAGTAEPKAASPLLELPAPLKGAPPGSKEATRDWC